MIFPSTPSVSAGKSLLVSSDTQTPQALSASTPRKQKLRMKMRRLEKQDSKMKCLKRKREDHLTTQDFGRWCDKLLSPTLSEIIKTHIALKNKAPIARRYSDEMKKFALSLYFLSPKAYAYLSKLMTLPTKRTLQRKTEKFSFNPGLQNENVFKALETKVKTMMPLDRHCILCIDEISIKSDLFYNTGTDEIIGFENLGNGNSTSSICRNVLVIMARGLYSPWKQPIAYFFVGSQLKAADLLPIMKETILKLRGSGLHVEAIASDMGSNFIELANSLGITPDNPVFEIRGERIFYIFDPCHLLKATRNNLLTHHLEFNGKKKHPGLLSKSFTTKTKRSSIGLPQN